MTMRDIRPLDRWLDEGWALLETAVPHVAIEVEHRLVTSLCTALLFRRPDHVELPVLGERVRRMIDTNTDDGFRFQASMFLVHLFYGWLGDARSGQPLVDAMQSVIEDDGQPTAHRLQALVACASQDWLNGRPERVFEAVDRGEELSRTSGLMVFDFHLRGMGIFSALDTGNAERAQTYLADAERIVDEGQHLRMAFVHLTRAWEAWQRNALVEADEHLARADDDVCLAGEPLFLRASVDLSWALVALSKGEDPADRLEAARRAARSMGSALLDYRCRLVDADRALADRRSDDCERVLSEAFSIARERLLYTSYWWDHEMAGRVCDFALQRDIERTYVLELIERQAIEPPPHCSERWPWPIRIYALGTLCLEINDAPASPAIMRQRKVIALLELLMISGNPTVSEVADALWPDSEADAAQIALKTNLHRLRALLGRSDAVVHAHGHVRLNEHVCWSDLATFDALTDSVQRGETLDLDSAMKALELYRGPLFGAAEGESVWMIAPAERFRQRFVRLVGAIGQHLEAGARWSDAIALYERALASHETEASFCQGLIRCLEGAGRSAEARAAYDRYRAAMAAAGAVPTEKTGVRARRPR